MITRLFVPIAILLMFVPAPVRPDWDPPEPTKWLQLPDENTTGVDVSAAANGPYDFILADDFRCILPDTVSSIHIWGSWRNDVIPFGAHADSVKFTLAIYTDIPASSSPNGFSIPGDLVWIRAFVPGEFTSRVWSDSVAEGWMIPPQQYIYPADTTCWQYNFPLPPGEEFVQTGTYESPMIYWLSVKAASYDESAEFGWKTSLDHWNDAAVWGVGDQPYFGPWGELTYPPGHAMDNQPIDLAFAIVGKNTELDWGDAPDTPSSPMYATLAVHNGARHVIAGPWLGEPADGPPDAESDGQPADSALGDDEDGYDDENGGLLTDITRGGVSGMSWWVTGDTSYVEIWIDYNRDQVWQHPEEQLGSFRSAPGNTPFLFGVPDSALLGDTYARYRVSIDGGLTPYGWAPDGEVEDHLVTIHPPFDEGKWWMSPDVWWGHAVEVIPPFIVADDFACTEKSLIREIDVFGAWRDDNLPYGSTDSVQFVLSFHEDIPASQSETGYSMPGDVLWLRTFEPGEFTTEVWREGHGGPQSWLKPPAIRVVTPGRTRWRYTFHVPEGEAFLQQGTEQDTVVYWLDVQALPFDGAAAFGWVSTYHHWNDAAVWGAGSEPYTGPWGMLVHPTGHYLEGLPFDMAFRLDSDPATAIDQETPRRVDYALYQSFPNPFNPQVVIAYDVPFGGGRVTLNVYDVRGRLVRTLVDGPVEGGRQTVSWNGSDESGRSVASGVYFYRLTAPGFEKTLKMVLLR